MTTAHVAKAPEEANNSTPAKPGGDTAPRRWPSASTEYENTG
eukprot:CAMPEP_0204480768 /NCGR_PEP_ID=MMETSP0471-20130131/44525_1 /ASSEMBLY_ACC=CAM_ASM_000602 /TAXON_ID=2969 /ORGANISM="Oxyrrhis marina" /LENGTH=41 /DNA_ID= /DNA_START= /DNA_END= /DNA_ORIENTATION=